MADDPGKDKKRKKRKIEHGKLIFGPQQTTQQQNNIIPFPSLITNKTEQTRNGNKTHTHTQKLTYVIFFVSRPIRIQLLRKYMGICKFHDSCLK